MLELPTSNLLPASISYELFAEAYLPKSQTVGVITGDQQHQQLTDCGKQVYKEKFYFLTNVSSGEVVQCSGAHRWLEYPDKNFTTKKFAQAILPSHSVVLSFYAAALYHYLKDAVWQPAFETPVLSGTLSVKTISGKWWYCKREIYPFQYRKDGKVETLLQEFTLIKEHDGELPCLRLMGAATRQADTFYKNLRLLFMHYSGFSAQEYRLLSAYTLAAETSNTALSKTFGIKKSTLETYNQRILRKAESNFDFAAQDARQAAIYFKRLKLIEML